jgi:Cu/Ag efflux pump CusA
VGSRDGQLIPLVQVADLTEEDGVAQIGREGCAAACASR